MVFICKNRDVMWLFLRWYGASIYSPQRGHYRASKEWVHSSLAWRVNELIGVTYRSLRDQRQLHCQQTHPKMGGNSQTASQELLPHIQEAPPVTREWAHPRNCNHLSDLEEQPHESCSDFIGFLNLMSLLPPLERSALTQRPTDRLHEQITNAVHWLQGSGL